MTAPDWSPFEDPTPQEWVDWFLKNNETGRLRIARQVLHHEQQLRTLRVKIALA